MFLQIKHKPQLVIARPVGNKMTKPLVTPRLLLDEKHVLLQRLDLLPVANNTAIAGKRLPLLGREKTQLAGVKSEKGFFEARPLILDNLPTKASLINRLGHHSQIAIVT